MLNVYVFVGGRVIEFRDSLEFDFQPIGEDKGLVEVKDESRGSVVIGEGDAVVLGQRTPTLWKKAESRSNGLYVGAHTRWFVLQPISRFERSPAPAADILKVFGPVQTFRTEERMVGLFWLRVGDMFGRGTNSPTETPEPEPEDRPDGSG